MQGLQERVTETVLKLISTVKNIIKNEKDSEKVKKIIEETQILQLGKLIPTLPQITKEFLVNKNFANIVQLMKQINGIISKVVQILEDYFPDQIQQLTEVDEDAASVAESLSNLGTFLKTNYLLNKSIGEEPSSTPNPTPTEPLLTPAPTSYNPPKLATAPVQKYSIAKPKLQNRKSASYSVAAFDILQSLDVNSLQKRTAQMGEINPNQNQSSIAELESKIQKLQIAKKEAAKNEDYATAEKHKNEIASLEKKLQQLKGEPKSAPVLVPLALQTSTNQQIQASKQSTMTEIQAKLAKLHELRIKAVKEEDYDAAHKLKVQIDKLKESLLEAAKREGQLPSKDDKEITPIKESSSSISKPISEEPPKNALITPGKQSQKLLDAVQASNLKIAKDLIELENADPNSLDPNTGDTPLHYAAALHYVDMCKFLVDRGANPNLKNRIGQTPLHIAFEQRTKEAVLFHPHFETIIKYFIEFGSGDIYIKDNEDKTALSYAPEHFQEKIAEYLNQVKQKNAPKAQTSNLKNDDTIPIYFGNEVTNFEIRLRIEDSVPQIIEMVASKAGLREIAQHLDLCETTYKKERALEPDESLIAVKARWELGDKGAKFIIRLKKGSPYEVQRKFREKLEKH